MTTWCKHPVHIDQHHFNFLEIAFAADQRIQSCLVNHDLETLWVSADFWVCYVHLSVLHVIELGVLIAHVFYSNTTNINISQIVKPLLV